MNTKHYDPTEAFISKLSPAWGDPLKEKDVSWELVLKIGVNNNGANR
jgi:hypothetical protein